MNDHKICFIYCVNNESLFKESLIYIHSLNIPEGYEIDIIPVFNPGSMAEGYNTAMVQSDAKYKVYLHEDVFIINKNFINDCISVFKINPRLGLMGLIGAEKLSGSGNWQDYPVKYGKVYGSNSSGKLSLISHDESSYDYAPVEMIDGFIMITQYDIVWREDLYKGWHFYDASQGMSFIRESYEVGVVYQDKPWVIHDCGIIERDYHYELYRQVFADQYSIAQDVQGQVFYRFGRNSIIEQGAQLVGTKGISIGDNVRLQKDTYMSLLHTNFDGKPRIIIKDGCDIGRNSSIVAVNTIIIEKDVVTEANVYITDHNNEYRQVGIPIKGQGLESTKNEVIIGEGTWIGANAVIMGNIKVGRGSVITANSTVTQDVPDYCVVAGNPASITEVFDRETGEWSTVNNEKEIKAALDKRNNAAPVLSICIPTYNRAKCLDICLHSIFRRSVMIRILKL